MLQVVVNGTGYIQRLTRATNLRYLGSEKQREMDMYYSYYREEEKGNCVTAIQYGRTIKAIVAC